MSDLWRLLNLEATTRASQAQAAEESKSGLPDVQAAQDERVEEGTAHQGRPQGQGDLAVARDLT